MATQNQLAQHLDLSVRSVASLVADGVIPKGASLDAARVAYIRNLREKAAGRTGGGDRDDEIAAEKLRLTKAQADKTEAEAQIENLKLEEQRGSLLQADVVEQLWSDHIAAARSRLLSLPSKIAAEFSTPKQRALVEARARKLVNEALEELATKDGEGDAGAGDAGAQSPDLEPTSRPDGERVGKRTPATKRRKQLGTGKV